MTNPQDPISTLAGGFIAMHEAYSEAIRAGFTREEAMSIVHKIIETSMILDRAERDGQ